MSPSFQMLHPVALLLQDCGLGSDPDATGPCTGTYGPEQLGEAVTGVLASGKGQLLSVGAALLALFAVVVLINMIRRPLKRSKPKDEPAAGDEDVAVDDLEPGQFLCFQCGAVSWRDEGDEPGAPCPCCGAGADEEEPPADAGVCSVCGVTSAELVGDLFPACPECAAASEHQRELDEMDGPDDEETFGGNPDGVGGGGVRA